MRTRVRKRRFFGFEPLESRAMLAGDVTVRVDGSDLVVTGDDNPNTVLIEGTGIAGQYVIQGDDTNVFYNGQLQGAAFIVTGATGNIIVDLNDGDDSLGINNVNVDRLIIDTDDGADIIGIGAFAAFANLSPGGTPPLPTGPEVNNGNLIDNDVPVATIGHFEINSLAGGESRAGGFTAQGQTLLFANADFIFDYFSYVDVGSDGGGVRLGATTITQPPTLVSPDVVQSAGTFQGQNGLVQWIATTSIANGDTRIQNSITFVGRSQTDQNGDGTLDPGPLGNLRFISYLDEDVGAPDDDIMYFSGTPGSANFKVFTVDGPQRVGFAQSGIYSAGPQLVNATWDGWAADEFSDLRSAITGAGTTYSPAGNIDLTDLPAAADPDLGQIFGPGDVTTAFAWTVNPQATTATITTFLEFVPRGQPAGINESDGSVGVNELLQINSGRGADLLALVRVFGDATWDINLGDDNDTTSNLTDNNPDNDRIAGIALDDQAYVYLASGGDIDINGGSGDDLVNINYLTTNGTLVVDGVTGNDVISINGSVFNDDVLLLGGSGNDTVALDFSRQDGGRDALTQIDSGAGNDFILFARSLFGESEVQIRSGGGSDRVIVGLYYADALGNLATGGNVVHILRVDTGADNDVADIRANVLDDLFAVFGGGDDDVTVAFNQINSPNSTLLDGGGGFDELFLAGNLFSEHTSIIGFESVNPFLPDGDSETPG
jgi:hypothetical protein